MESASGSNAMNQVGRDATADTLPSEQPGSCLSEDELLAFASGHSGEAAQRARVDRHLDQCPLCFELVLEVARHSESFVSASFGPSVPMATTFVAGNLVSARYVVERFVARGGMGEVYEARDCKLGERVALKTVLCTAADNPRAARKLLEEVQLARRIQHRNVCRIHELHEHSDKVHAVVQFLSMEFIEGERLGDYVRRRGRLPIEEALTLAQQLLDGLQAAHAAQVLHLDFKTDNVMLRRIPQGLEAVIMDFGLSRAFEAEAKLRTSEPRQLAGSLAYMSPEQVECQERLGPEADIYAFGVVLFEMLTGQLPFAGNSPVAVMLKRLKERPPPPSRSVPEVPAALDAFVLKCMSRDLRGRYRDIAQARLALNEAVASSRSRRWPSWGAAVLAVALLSGMLAAARQLRRADTPPTPSIAAPAALHAAPAGVALVDVPPPAAAAPPTPVDEKGTEPAVLQKPSLATSEAQPVAQRTLPARRSRVRKAETPPKPETPGEQPAESLQGPSRRLPGAPTRLSW
jgi:Protein kinase domain